MVGKADVLGEDAMIAAIAGIYGLTVATRNEADFPSFAVPIFNPFKASRTQ
jgi:predicted nucleic acid-binding protein